MTQLRRPTMALYGGIDLHANNSLIALLDAHDQVVAEKRLPNDLNTILAYLAPYHAELTGLVVESTYNWYWLVDGLRDAGYRVHLAHTAAIKQYEGLKFSNDQVDARWLAHLLRLLDSCDLPRQGQHATLGPGRIR
jgi:transposase